MSEESRTAPLPHRVRPLRHRVIALCPHGQCKRATRILPGPQTIERVAEVVAGPPAELAPGPIVHVDAVDAGKHLPAALRVDRLVVREALPDDGRGVRAQ